MSQQTAFERPWLTEYLVCPLCSAPLRREEDSLACANGHRHEIIAGIPRFVPPSSYADNFGFEWTTFPRLQLDDDSSSESELSFAEKTGLTPSDVEGRSVFDAGCGMGRFSNVVAGWGAARVVGVDISRAVDAAADNLATCDRVAFAQADLRHLPLADQSFDIVFSIGVLHHTPNTFASLSRVAPLVKPGGTLAVWVYSPPAAVDACRWRDRPADHESFAGGAPAEGDPLGDSPDAPPQGRPAPDNQGTRPCPADIEPRERGLARSRHLRLVLPAVPVETLERRGGGVVPNTRL